MEEALVYFIVTLIAVSFSSFNILTLSIIFLNKKLRHRSANFPIVSFLVASAFQGLVPAPVFVYQQFIEDESTLTWTCNVYRFPYLFCGHIMKISLMLVSFDRMLAVKYPFKYKDRLTPRYMILTLVLVWIITIAVDIIPFIHKRKPGCAYIPTKYWGISVLVAYDLLPFLIIVINYSIVWSLAAKFAFQDKNRKESLNYSQEYLNVTDDADDNDVVYKDNAPLLPKRKFGSYGSLNGSQSGNRALSNIRLLLDIRATKTSLILVAVYLICWGPLGLFYTMDHFCNGCLSTNDGTREARLVIKLLNFSSCVLAPIGYCWWNKEYRKIAKQVCWRCCWSCRHDNDQILQGTSSKAHRSIGKSWRRSQLPKIEETIN